jgi:uncharacterized protein
MSQDLDDLLGHLPRRQREELRRALGILFEEFAETLKTKLSPKRKKGRILKVVLFGSHARGDWTIDRGTGYVSDFDLLIVVSDEEFVDSDYWYGVEKRFSELDAIHPFRPRPSLIVHSLQDVNDQLSRGRYFFMDILREGITLYEAPGHPFAKPRPLEPEIAGKEAQSYFDTWFPGAIRRFELAQEALSRGYGREAAFDMHQAVERLYYCTLLVLSLYTPKLHDIKKLGEYCEPFDPRFKAIWPRDTKFTRRSFERLRRAYVDARYSMHYEITTEELAWIDERIVELQDLVRDVCEKRLAQISSAQPGVGGNP